MPFSPSSYYSDTSTDASLLSPVQDQLTHSPDDYDHRWDPNWREVSNSSTVNEQSAPVLDRSTSNPADYDHGWDPKWQEGSEEQHLYIFNRLPPPEGVFIMNLFILLSRRGRILDVTTFEGMEYDNLTRRFPCYAIRMGITHGDDSVVDYAIDAARTIMVELREELGVHAIVERVLANREVPGLTEPLGPDQDEEHQQPSGQIPPRPQRPRTPMVQEPLEDSGSPRHDHQLHHHRHGSHEGGSQKLPLHKALRLRGNKHKPGYLRSLSDSFLRKDAKE